jgi:ribosomal protection tetracycline resistance protein
MDAAVTLAEHDEELLAAVIDGRVPSETQLTEALRSQLAGCFAQPVVFGSALGGTGVSELLAAIALLAPTADGNDDAPLSARVFKIERAADGARTAITRLFSGRISVRDQVVHGDGKVGRVTQLSVYEPGGARPSHTGAAGQIVGILGLRDVRVGDFLGQPIAHVAERQFPPPTLEAVVSPLARADKARMRNALIELAEQDPLINVRQDDERDEISVSLYGDVQREVIQATLERDYGVRASFQQLTVICIERPASEGFAEEVISAPTHTNISGRSSPDSANPYRATLALRVAPRDAGSGVHVAFEVDVHLVPIYIFKTVNAFEVALGEYIHECLRAGLHGWQVTDCLVTVCDSGYSRTGSTARDFRLLTAVVLRAALEQADTVVYEPMTRLKVDMPTPSAAAVGKMLGHLMARVDGQFSTAEVTTISARVPAATVPEIKQRLPGLTSGQGVLEIDFAGYEPVIGPPPERRRSSK